MSRRRLEFEPGKAGVCIDKLRKLIDTDGFKFNGCPTMTDSHFLIGCSINWLQLGLFYPETLQYSLGAALRYR